MEVYGTRIDVKTTDELVYDVPQPRFLKDSSRADSTLSQISGISYTDSSSGELVRILLAPYMSPYIVSVKKVKTWESLVQSLQRLFGDSFCSLEDPPHITNHHGGATIGEEQWTKALKPDLTIVVHTLKKEAMMLHRKTSSTSKGHSKSPSCELLTTGGTVVAIGVQSPTGNNSSSSSSNQKQKGIKRERSLQNLLAQYRMPKHGKSASDGLPPQPVPPPPPAGGETYSNTNFVPHSERPALRSIFESYNEKDGKQKSKMGKKIWGAMVSVFKDHSEQHESSPQANTSGSSNSGSQDYGQPDNKNNSQQAMHVASLERARPKKRKDRTGKRNSKVVVATAAKRNSRRLDGGSPQSVAVASTKDRKNKDLLRMTRKKRRSHQMSPTKRTSLERSLSHDQDHVDQVSPSLDAYSPTSTAVEEPRTSFTNESPKEYSPMKMLPPTPISPTSGAPFSPPPTRLPPPPPPMFIEERQKKPVPEIPSPPTSPVDTVRPLTIHREKEPTHTIREDSTISPVHEIPVVEKKHRRTLSKGSITSIRPRLSLRTSANSLKEMAARHLRSDSKSRTLSNSSAISPPVPPRPKESVGLNAQYDCLDEEVIRKTVEDLMNGIKKSMEEEPETPVEPSSPTSTKERTTKSKSSKPKSSESPRRKRRGTNASSGADGPRPDSRGSRRTTRSRADSVASGSTNRHSNMPYDSKPLPKLPYKFSMFPAPTPTTPTFYNTPAPSTTNISIKNGHLPHIAPFEELVRNTRSYSDAASRERPSTAGRNGSISSASGHRVHLQRHGSNASATTAVTAATVSER